MLVDSHCHFDLMKEHETAALIEQARLAEVGYFLTVSVDLPTFPSVLSAAEQFSNVFASVGVHPNHCVEQADIPPVNQATLTEELVQLAQHPKVVAIGETGLDYFRTSAEFIQEQQAIFRLHIQAAKQTQKPLIVHTREAKADTLAILKAENAQDVGGVMHCFVEDWETAKAAIEMGFYISFSGIVTFKTAKELQEVAKQVPLEYMLVETDSPYLAPVPYRGKMNQPAYVKQVAQFIADLRGISLTQLTEQTTENFFKLFKTAKAS